MKLPATLDQYQRIAMCCHQLISCCHAVPGSPPDPPCKPFSAALDEKGFTRNRSTTHTPTKLLLNEHPISLSLWRLRSCTCRGRAGTV